MPASLKTFLQYLLILSITIVLIWLSLRGLEVTDGGDKWDYLKLTFKQADKSWLLFMAVVAMASHVVRAERWRMLMKSSGHQVTLTNSFLSLMVGYLVNLVIPRGGEVSRCYNLYRLEKTPIDVSFGTVVVERIIDLFCLLFLIAISFFAESAKLIAFIQTLPIGTEAFTNQISIIGLILIIGLFMLTILIVLAKRNKKFQAFINKTWNGFKDGLLAVFNLRQKTLFIFYTLLIWAFYFLMSYAVIKAFPATSELGFSAILSLFAIGAIAMAAPLPGGMGSYHVLVPQGLIFLYAISRTDAVAFTFIFHGWQTLIVILAGALSLLITTIVARKKNAKHSI